MVKYLLTFLFLTFNLQGLYSQAICIEDYEGNCIAKGEFKTVKIKTSYGAKMSVQLRIGKWEFYNTESTLIAKGLYSIDNNVQMKNEEWLYYNKSGEMMMKRVYKNNQLISTIYVGSGNLEFEGDTIEIREDSFENYQVNYKKGVINYTFTTSANVVKYGDPMIDAYIQHKRNELAKEQKPVTEDDIINQFPLIKSTLNIKRWDVNSPNNLIQNGDFEMSSMNMEPGHTSQIKPISDKYANFWGSSNETPDIFKSLDNCYGGYRVFGVNYEVLRNQLKSPLIAGKKYCLQFRLKLKKENQYSVNGVSVCVSDKLYQIKNSEEAKQVGIVMQTHPDISLCLRDNWMTISGSFTAIGNEKYLYIGNFTESKQFRIDKLEKKAMDYADEIYYYIDDVVLIEEKENSICPCNVAGCEIKKEEITTPELSQTFTNIEVGKVLILNNIQFNTNESILLESSYSTLDSVYYMLEQNPNMKIEITGHTDNKGNAAANLTLSENRAFTVVMYLVDKGIDQSRLSYQGKGQTSPIDNNNTEQGRYNNRRVEFKILEI